MSLLRTTVVHLLEHIYVFVYVAYCIVRHKEINPLDDQWKEDVDQVEREQFVCFYPIIIVLSLDYSHSSLLVTKI